MSTYREVTYMVLDKLKLVSDDSHFQEEHIIYLLDKYRCMILKQQYKDLKKEIPESNYQTICLDLERTPAINGIPCEGPDYLKSAKKIPHMLEIGKHKVSSTDFFQGNFAYVNNERFKYVGNNKYLKNQIYSTIAPDNHLYLKSNNPQLYYLERVKLTGIFEDSEATAKLQCPDDTGETVCDVMDMKFPLEEAFIPILIDTLCKDLGMFINQPADTINNSADDQSNLQNYVARNIKDQRYRS